MKPELEAELSKSVMGITPGEGNNESVIKFINEHTRDLTPDELTEITLLGMAIGDRFAPPKVEEIRKSLLTIFKISRKTS